MEYDKTQEKQQANRSNGTLHLARNFGVRGDVGTFKSENQDGCVVGNISGHLHITAHFMRVCA